MRLLFAGTPQVSVPSLEALADHFEVVAVLTRPDAVRGRGRKPTPSPVKAAALRLGIKVIESNPKDAEFLTTLKDLRVDAAAVVAYGRILTQPVLDAVPLGWYNLHFSLLPQWRGAAPVQRAIWNGDTFTGLTVFKITAGMDSGPIVVQKKVPIEGRPSAGELLDSLSQIGSKVFVNAFESLDAGTATLTPQPEVTDDIRSYAKKISTDDARADFSLSPVQLDQRIRACNPDPGAWCEVHGTDSKPYVLHLNEVDPVEASDPAFESALEAQHLAVDALVPGALVVSKKHVWVACAEGQLELINVTAAGKKPMRAADWARGAHLGEGAHLA